MVHDAAELARWADALLRDPARRDAMAQPPAAAVGAARRLPCRTAAALLELWTDDAAADVLAARGLLAGLLSPVAAIVAAVTAAHGAAGLARAGTGHLLRQRDRRRGRQDHVALDLGARLIARGRAVHFLLRGYGGSIRGPHRVGVATLRPRWATKPLLLAAAAPTWIGADRAASARAAIAAGAQVLVMDDGLQNAGLHKDLSLLVVDGVSGFGNGRVLPAGPLREPVAAAAARCQAVVLIGPRA